MSLIAKGIIDSLLIELFWTFVGLFILIISMNFIIKDTKKNKKVSLDYAKQVIAGLAGG